MLAVNMSFDTLILEHQSLDDVGLKPADVFALPVDDEIIRFTKHGVREGILSMVLRTGMNKRNEAKAQMKKHEGVPERKYLYNRYNMRQIAWKLVNNSVYGFTGVKRGQLPCVQIGKSVTYWGRQAIELTAQATTRPYVKPPRLAAELESQYHARVGTPKEHLSKQANESDAEFAARKARLAKEYLANRRPETAEQHDKRWKDALREYPIPRLENETEEDHQKRINGEIEFIYGDTDSIMVSHKTSKGAQDTIDLGKAFAKWLSKWFFLEPMQVRYCVILQDLRKAQILFEKMYVHLRFRCFNFFAMFCTSSSTECGRFFL